MEQKFDVAGEPGEEDHGPQTSQDEQGATGIEVLVAAAAKFDDVTEYSIEWCIDALDAVEPFIGTLECLDEEAVRSIVEAALEGNPKPNWFAHYDHGSEYAMWGDDEKPIIDLSNLDKLAGMHVYCMNCSSGKGLGAHAIEKGILEYLGYMGPVSFTTDAADEFGEVLSFGLVKAITEGLFLKNIEADMRQHGYDVADELEMKGKILAASCMVEDMNLLHVYHEGGPPPPDPECKISRGLLKLFGWNGLHLLRMLRQKAFPDKPPERR